MKYLCAVPVVEAFVNPGGGFKNCCAAFPQIKSQPDRDFADWWTGPEMTQFRDSLAGSELPPDCYRCAIKEQTQGRSFRTAVNGMVDMESLTLDWPSRWNLIFGNVCNLACWICNENSSSVIETQKKKIGIIPNDFESPQQRFEQAWPALRANILKSYQHHETVTLTILGGEPLYNRDVFEFLSLLKEQGLSARTKLEFHTNATQCNDRIIKLLDRDSWNYTCIFMSLDASGAKAEWLRYGCRWSDIEKNVDVYRKMANYLEVHCAVGVLNVMDLPALREFCDSNQLPLDVNLVSNPDFMSLATWDQPADQLVARADLEKYGYERFYDLIGSQAVPGSQSRLVNYVKQFDGIRTPLREFDAQSAAKLGLD